MSGQHNRSDMLTKSSYRSGKLLNPKSSKVKEKYFEIYQTYILTHATEKELADRYSLGLSHISAIIKWCVYQVDTEDNSDKYFQVLDDKLSHKLQQLELDLQKKDLENKEKIMFYAEIRRTLKLQAQVRKVLGPDGGGGAAVQVNLNSNVPHRTGTQNAEVKIIDGETKNS